MSTISAEQLFVPRAEEPKKEVKAQAKPAVVPAEQVFVPKDPKKRYIVYLIMEESCETIAVKIDNRCTRAEIIQRIVENITDYYEDITEETDITGETMYSLLSSSDVFCLNDNNESFAKTDLLSFLLSFRDVVLPEESINQTFKEYMDLVVEFAENMMNDEDYDAGDCRDVLEEN